MKTLIPLGAAALVVCAFLTGPALGHEPPTRGKILILDNERTLDGEIERHGDQYLIQRSIGETWIKAEKVLGLFQTYEEAYAFLRARANLMDPDERLRLARWCQKHQLREQALEEATNAVRLRPTHAESRRLLSYLQRPATPVSEAAEPPKENNTDEVPPLPPIELSTELMSQYVTKVQPILMNACANCHATGRGGPFKLTRSLATGPTSTRLTQQNLAAVLGQIHPDQPQASPLLMKAVSIHGEATQPPLKGRQVAAFHTLENWVRQTVSKNPQAARTVTSSPPAEPPTPETRSTHWAADAPPKTPMKSADPFDPAAFNRQAHPPK